MSSTCGIPIPVSQSGNAEICGSSATLSSSHKRVGSCSQVSLYVPEAKRPQLSSPTNDNWPQGSGANFTLDDSEEVEDGNIASTDSYIEELLDIIQSGDEASPPFNHTGSNGTDSTSSSPPLLFHLHTEEANLPTPLPADTASQNLLKLSQLLPDTGAGNKHELFELGHSNGGEVVVLDIDDYYDDMMGIVLLKSLPTSIDDLAMSEAEAASVLDRNGGQVERTDIALERLSFDDEDSLAGKPLLDSRPFDEDDLEVAMINESFEEQQKQSLAYECGALESFFLSEASTSVEGVGKPDLSEASTSSSNSETDDMSTSEEDTDEPCHVSPKSSEFIPVLTPKSRSFVKGHPLGQTSTSSHPHSGKTNVLHVDYDTPTVVQPKSGKPLRRHPDDDERSRRLNEKLKMMMLAGQNETTPAGLRIQDDRQRCGLIKIQTYLRADSGEKDVSSTTILDECADAAEAIAHGVVASLFSSPVVFAEKSPTEERGRTPANVEQLYACEDEETDFVEAKLLSQSLLRDLSVLSEEESPTKDHLKSEIVTCLGAKSLYAGSGAHNSSSTNSSSSAICVLAEAKLEADEQKVPIVD